MVDDLKRGQKFSNLVECDFWDYVDKDRFITSLYEEEHSMLFEQLDAIFHQGACVKTTEWDGQYMMENNYQYSRVLLESALKYHVPFIYASSAAVYGKSQNFSDQPRLEKPLNVYGYSKFLFDRYVQRLFSSAESQIVGLRYFNVYGPGEAYKDSMASVAYHLDQQLKDTGEMRLFGAFDGYAAGEQKRDFVYVRDVVDVNLWFLNNPQCSGIFNVGTGESQTFNDVAQAVRAFHRQGELRYIDFPEHLKNAYQSFTQADITSLRKVGYHNAFESVESGVKHYLSSIA